MTQTPNRVLKPSGVPLVADFFKSDYSHRTAIQEDGDYKVRLKSYVCLTTSASQS